MLSLIASFLMLSAPVPGTSGWDPSTSFDTAEAASHAAIQAAAAASLNKEFAGGIVELDGRFYFTLPATTNRPADVSVKILFPHGAKLVAIYHTHPGRQEHESCNMEPWHPSSHDVEVAQDLHLESYIGDLAGGRLVRIESNGSWKIIGVWK